MMDTSVRLYRLILRLLPRSLRERYGEEMTELFAERLADRPASRWARLRLLVKSAWDVVAQGAAERRNLRRRQRADRATEQSKTSSVLGGDDARPYRARVSGSLVRAQVRVAVRQLYRTPVATGAIIVTLAVAVGATTAIYSVVRSVLFRALPYDQPEALALIYSVRTDRADAPFTLPEFIDYRDRVHGIDLAAYAQWSANLTLPDVTRRLQGVRISANGLGLLGIRPAAGRLLEPSDDEPTAPKVAVIGDSFWQSEFGARADVIGETIRLNAVPYTVVRVQRVRYGRRTNRRARQPGARRRAFPGVRSDRSAPAHR